MKPDDWPRYLETRGTRDQTRYYWVAPAKWVERGFRVRSVPLGTEYAQARDEAIRLNRELDEFRGVAMAPDGPAFGTIAWWLEEYLTSAAYANGVSDRSASEDRRHIRIICETGTKTGGHVGELLVKTITPAFADKLYTRLVEPRTAESAEEVEAADEAAELQRPKRLRQAEIEIGILRRAWGVVKRLHKHEFPDGDNPFAGVTFTKRRKVVKEAATREEAYALASALREIGHPHLGAAALIAFEWLQRPENIAQGGVPSWTDYHPGDRATIEHPKVLGEPVELILYDEAGPLFPDLEAYLQQLPRLGVPIVLMQAKRGPNRPYGRRRMHKIVAEAREHAGLGPHVTLGACRHGGMTECGDAGLTDSEIMSLSGHKTVQVLRRYVKPTAIQRSRGARKRRDHANGA